jgi:(p)ppGpp synthase/HD superfamily hydrolase
MDVEDPPAFTGRSPLLLEAYRFAAMAHEGPRSTGETSIGHPVAVAGLLAEAGFPDDVVAASLLHDVLEDTVTTDRELRERFGERVADLVLAVSEDPGIDGYAARKAELRRRALWSGRQAAAIFAADKLASTRAADGSSTPAPKLEHYAATLDGLCRQYPDLPFLAELQAELRRLRAER